MSTQPERRSGWVGTTEPPRDVDLNDEFETYVDDGMTGSPPTVVSGATAAGDSSGITPVPEAQRPRHRAAELLAPEGVGVKQPAQEGWRGALNRVGLHLKAGPAEMSARQDRAAICVNLSRCMTVTVANPDGGAGKTPATAILAGAFGLERGGGVVAWDNNELRGALALRTASGGHRTTVRDLLDGGDAADTGHRGDVDRFLRHQQAGHYKVLASADGGDQPLVSGEEFFRVHSLLQRYFDLVVIDTGNNEGAENWRSAIEVTDQLVVPVKWKATSCTIAARMLEDLERRGLDRLVGGAVIVAMNGPGDASSKHRDRYLEYFTERARAVVEIPTDPHIHDDGVIEHDALDQKTARAVNKLAARVAEGLAEAQDMGTNRKGRE